MQLRGVRRAAAWCATCSCVMLVVQIMVEKFFWDTFYYRTQKAVVEVNLGIEKEYCVTVLYLLRTDNKDVIFSVLFRLS